MSTNRPCRVVQPENSYSSAGLHNQRILTVHQGCTSREFLQFSSSKSVLFPEVLKFFFFTSIKEKNLWLLGIQLTFQACLQCQKCFDGHSQICKSWYWPPEHKGGPIFHSSNQRRDSLINIILWGKEQIFPNLPKNFSCLIIHRLWKNRLLGLCYKTNDTLKNKTFLKCNGITVLAEIFLVKKYVKILTLEQRYGKKKTTRNWY